MAAARSSYGTRRRVTVEMDSIAAQQVSRAARFALRDAEYRIRLGLEPESPLPSTIGHTAGHARGGAIRRDPSGGRHTLSRIGDFI